MSEIFNFNCFIFRYLYVCARDIDLSRCEYAARSSYLCGFKFNNPRTTLSYCGERDSNN